MELLESGKSVLASNNRWYQSLEDAKRNDKIDNFEYCWIVNNNNNVVLFSTKRQSELVKSKNYEGVSIYPVLEIKNK